MIKSKFIIFGGGRKPAYKVVDGYILQNGDYWMGIHRTVVDDKQVWSVTYLYYGLRYKTFPTRKEAEAAAKSKNVILAIKEVLKNDKSRKSFAEFQKQIKEQYASPEHDEDIALVKTYQKMYGEEW